MTRERESDMGSTHDTQQKCMAAARAYSERARMVFVEEAERDYAFVADDLDQRVLVEVRVFGSPDGGIDVESLMSTHGCVRHDLIELRLIAEDRALLRHIRAYEPEGGE